jgi:hypothetical protein
MSLLAKSIVKDKFWIVENNGVKYATIQSAPDGVVFVQDQNREKFPSIKTLKTKYNILFDRAKLTKNEKQNNKQVYGLPIKGKAFNIVYDVVRKLPIYTQSAKSKSCYCAGYYLVNIKGEWEEMFCPKLLVLQRHEFMGPYISSTKDCCDE